MTDDDYNEQPLLTPAELERLKQEVKATDDHLADLQAVVAAKIATVEGMNAGLPPTHPKAAQLIALRAEFDQNQAARRELKCDGERLIGLAEGATR